MPDRTDFISDIEIIHNKALFDSLNEALDYFRPYSVRGIPYPWKSTPHAIPRMVDESEVDIILEKAKEKVLFWATFQAGYLGNMLHVEGSSPEKKDELLLQIKEERLSKALAFEVNYFVNYAVSMCMFSLNRYMTKKKNGSLMMISAPS